MKEQRRPSPDDLLKLAQQESRQKEQGKLRIYLGAAPGVGKTYTMLQDAHMKRQEGLDVVVGVAESHGRREIEALLEGLEVLPRQTVEYRGIKLTEFDLDGALKRNPGLILIDEMAHTNAPGLRHEKRWQDIKELLDRGINVYTTVNAQHIESRKNDVAKIIHMQIKESVPDSMFEIANTIELVDLPPEELIKRLHEGKVYFPQQIELAKENFFRIGNLIALREIALRYTADRVGAEVLLYRQGQHIQHIWPTRDKILVCVGPGQSDKLIRSAARIANSLQAEWIAIHIDTPRQPSAEDYNRAVQKLQLAEKLGAETRLIVGTDITKEILAFAQEQNITQIIMWKNSHQSWRDYIKNWKNILPSGYGIAFSSLADKIVRKSGDIDIYVMTGSKKNPQPTLSPSKKKQKIEWQPYIMATSICATATLINYLLYPMANAISVIMIYFFGVILVALYSRILPTIYAAIISALVSIYFFLSPYYSLSIDEGSYIFNLILMLFMALMVNYYIRISQREASRARRAERQIALLHYLTRKLAKARGLDNLLAIAVSRISEIFDCEVQALLPEKGHLIVRAQSNSGWTLDDKEAGVAQWVYDNSQAAGLGTDTLPFSQALYMPLSASHVTIGVLSILPNAKERLLTPQQKHLLEAFANQLATALETELQAHK